MKLKKLSRSFYLRPTLTIAKDLLGKYFVRTYNGRRLVGKIVEVEAYLGERDPASHAYRGKTKRNEVMFWEGGHLYVYFTYGMHFCANVVTREKGIAEAVLIRAVEPMQGIEMMRKNRGEKWSTGVLEKWGNARTVDLTNGPAKFCKAFAIQRKHNGTNLLGDEIFIAEGTYISKSKIVATTRIGIKNGMEKKWRFYIKENPCVSRKW